MSYENYNNDNLINSLVFQSQVEVLYPQDFVESLWEETSPNPRKYTIQDDFRNISIKEVLLVTPFILSVYLGLTVPKLLNKKPQILLAGYRIEQSAGSIQQVLGDKIKRDIPKAELIVDLGLNIIEKTVSIADWNTVDEDIGEEIVLKVVR
jgi:hypothetical protein